MPSIMPNYAEHPDRYSQERTDSSPQLRAEARARARSNRLVREGGAYPAIRTVRQPTRIRSDDQTDRRSENPDPPLLHDCSNRDSLMSDPASLRDDLRFIYCFCALPPLPGTPVGFSFPEPRAKPSCPSLSSPAEHTERLRTSVPDHTDHNTVNTLEHDTRERTGGGVKGR